MRNRPLTLLSMLIAIVALYSFYPHASAKIKRPEDIQPLATIQVTNTNDSGSGSLRSAISSANNSTNTVIQFNIPKTDAGFNGKTFVIKLMSALPVINGLGTVIDATTQTTATGNTNVSGPEVVLNGQATNGADGLRVSANTVAIRGFVINSFTNGNGILINGGSLGTNITKCYIGTDETGTLAIGNKVGLRIEGNAANSMIGGSPDTGNLISGNLANGVEIAGTATNNTLIGNLIGVDSSGSQAPLPNLNNGILISGGAKSNNIGGSANNTGNIISGNLNNGILITGSSTTGNKIMNNTIGTTPNKSSRGNTLSGVMIMDGADTNTIGPSNTIAFNAGNGVTVGSSASASTVVKNRITRNSIFMNNGIGIDLGNDGVTRNDAQDSDNGPNGLINYPNIDSITTSSGITTVRGRVDFPNSLNGIVEIFANTLPLPGKDPSGFGQGEIFAGAGAIDATGTFVVTLTINTNNVVFSGTSTDSAGNTSEFSPNSSAGGKPDVIITGTSVSPSTIKDISAPITLKFTVKNQGDASTTRGFQNDIILSTTSDPTNGLMINSLQAPPLAPQESANLTTTFMLDAATNSGKLFIIVVGDGTKLISESNENNNTDSATITITAMPDLVVNNLKISKNSVMPGDTIRVDFAVANTGSANADKHFEEVRLSPNNTIGDSDDIVLRAESSNGIAGNSNAQFSLDVKIPSATTPASYIIGVFADARGAITEGNENNNTASTGLAVSGSLDFDLTNLSLSPTSGGGNTTVTVATQITNRGNLSSPATSIDIRLSSDQKIDTTDMLLGTFMASALSPSQTANLSFMVTIPGNITAGRVFIGLIVDPQNQIAESNENNNTISAAFTINDTTPPMVKVQTPNGNDIIVAGEPFTIQWTTTDNVSVASQDILLSTDGGANFNQIIVTGLIGTANSFIWTVPTTLNSTTARIQVVAKDAAGNIGSDASDSSFLVGLRPTIINPVYTKGKLSFLVTGSNILTNATLTVINGSSKETFAIGLNMDNSQYLVAKKTLSSPSALKLKQAIPTGVPVMLVVTNPNGIASQPINFQHN